MSKEKNLEPIPTLVNLGKLLRKSRRDKELSQNDVAEKLSVSRATYNRIEIGDYNSSAATLIEACRELEIHNIKIID